MAPLAEPPVLGVPWSRRCHASLPDCPHLRVRSLHEADQEVPLLRRAGELGVHHRGMAPTGHGKADGNFTQRRKCDSSLCRRISRHSWVAKFELFDGKRS